MKHTKEALGDFFIYMDRLKSIFTLRMHVEWLLEGEEQYKQRIRDNSSLCEELIDLLLQLLKYWAEEQNYSGF